MKTQHTPGKWYEGKTGNHQGLVIEEGTGRNIAVTYDKKDAPLIAAAPELLEALEELLSEWDNEMTSQQERFGIPRGPSPGELLAEAAIKKAIGER